MHRARELWSPSHFGHHHGRTSHPFDTEPGPWLSVWRGIRRTVGNGLGQRQRAHGAGLPPEWSLHIFCAKEAAFKSVAPWLEQPTDPADIEIDLDTGSKHIHGLPRQPAPERLLRNEQHTCLRSGGVLTQISGAAVNTPSLRGVLVPSCRSRAAPPRIGRPRSQSRDVFAWGCEYRKGGWLAMSGWTRHRAHRSRRFSAHPAGEP
ncbi:MAG: 4'-phosphopantetheinyl transferase family protein [Nocardioides sp.]